MQILDLSCAKNAFKKLIEYQNCNYYFRIVCEQVSHHPPVSAFHAESDEFVFHGTIHPKLKFWGTSIEIHPKGIVTVELPK